MPSSTFNDQVQAQQKRNKYAESAYWESEAGQTFLLRLIVSTLYTFGIKAGVGAGRLEEFLEHIRLFTHVGISERSIIRLVKKIELSILKYQKLQEQDLYWQFHLKKVSPRKKDKSLKAYYQKRATDAQLKLTKSEDAINFEN